MSDKEISSEYIRQLIQLYESPTSDNNLISVYYRDRLIETGLAKKSWGKNRITSKGVKYLKDYGLV